MRKILFFVNLLILSIATFTSTALAQPTNKFDCEWIPTDPFTGVCRVNVSTIACAPGFCTSPIECATSFQSVCDTLKGIDCVPCSSPTPTPTPPPACIPDGQCIGPTDSCCSGNQYFDTACPVTEERCGPGTCTCVFSGGFSCDNVSQNNCARNFSPVCQGCSASPGCLCEATPPGCGDENEPCCPGNTCSALLSCIDISGLPGATPRCLRPCETDDDCNVSIGEICYNGACTADPIYSPPGPPPEFKIPIFCDSSGDPTTENTGDLYTAIGCIPFTSENAFTRFFLSWGIGIAGGISFILIVVAAFQVITSSGDPKKLQAGKELLTASVLGLAFLIFSAFILRIIGVELLNIPGFG